MEIIYITGISATGKTTLANKIEIKLNIPVLSIDNIHFHYLRLKENKTVEETVKSIWKGYFNKHKENYIKLYKIFDKLIIEGENLIMQEEIEYINNILKPTKYKIIILQGPEHKKWFKEKWDSEEMQVNIDFFNKHYQPEGYHRNAIILKDYNKIWEII